MRLLLKKKGTCAPFLLILTMILVTFSILSCSYSTSSDPENPDPEPPLSPPEQVTVELIDKVMRVSWSSVAGVDQFQVFRKEGISDYELITPFLCTGTNYDDDAYDPDELLEYVVVSCRDDEYSHPSYPSNKISRYIRNLQASRFAYTVGHPDQHTGGQILISWDKHPRATSYKVYRYRSKSEEPISVKETDNTFLGDGYEADGIEPDKPYYYRVAWKQWNREYGKDGPFAIGIFSTTKDYHEPNDDYQRLLDQTSSTVFNSSQPPMIYSFGDSQAGNLERDVDWYKYYGPAEAFSVEVELPPDSPFQGGELRFQFFYNSSESGPEEQIWRDTPNSFTFTSFGAAAGEVSVYFKVYPVVSSVRNVFGSYFVTIKEGI